MEHPPAGQRGKEVSQVSQGKGYVEWGHEKTRGPMSSQCSLCRQESVRNQVGIFRSLSWLC